MKTRYFSLSIFLTVVILLTSQFKSKYESGPPAGVSGSPGDAANCAACHGGSAPNSPNLITSDIPVTGYIPGATYNMTATVSHPIFNKFGFQVSPQNATGQQKGTLMVNDGTRTQLTGGSKYIMHKTAGTAGTSNSATWTFQWKAPVSGSGNVTFYGAFVKSNANAQSSGDAVTVSQLAITENLSTGINESVAETEEWKVYPMPCTNELTITLANNTSQKVRIMIRTLDGKVVAQDVLNNINGTFKLNTDQLPTGIYMLTVFEDNRALSKKLIKL
ncbi:MAG: T9SS type A sorting domain-containing protein [Bacteroidetes bacterium]|nr:T9SS type A sorting domain-containing protein [Bacteroidota bacterium]